MKCDSLNCNQEATIHANYRKPIHLCLAHAEELLDDILSLINSIDLEIPRCPTCNSVLTSQDQSAEDLFFCIECNATIPDEKIVWED